MVAHDQGEPSLTLKVLAENLVRGDDFAGFHLEGVEQIAVDGDVLASVGFQSEDQTSPQVVTQCGLRLWRGAAGAGDAEMQVVQDDHASLLTVMICVCGATQDDAVMVVCSM